MSITGVKIRGACCGAGERKLCLIINRAIRCSSLRVLFLCSSEQKNQSVLQKLSMLASGFCAGGSEHRQGRAQMCLVTFEFRGSSIWKKPDKSQEFKWS